MGTIVTFYSYKGGVGRTMAVANIGVLLARQQKRVLLVDWDLEAPGLHRYFADYNLRATNAGLLDLLEGGSAKGWITYTSRVIIDDSTTLTVLTAGRFDEKYDTRVLRFDWNYFFQKLNGGAVLEALRREWINSYDVILIDSRTGITDSGGVCTVQMPDVLIPVFSPNRQSLDGTKHVVLRAQAARQELAYDRTRLLVFPLLSRFDSRTEYKESQTWLRIFAHELKDFYSDWVSKDTNIVQILERTKLPYVAFFSFGEKLPAVTEGTTDPESLGFAYQNAATLIANDFKNADRLLAPASGGSEQDRLLSDVRLGAHQDFTLPKLEDIRQFGFVGMYCYPNRVVSIPVDEIERFLQRNRLNFAEETRLARILDVFQDGVAMGISGPRNPRNYRHRITIYTDGFVALDAVADILLHKEHRMHLGWLTYELQRHLQLAKAVLSSSGVSTIQVLVDLKSIDQFVLWFSEGGPFQTTAGYSGRHNPIRRQVRISDIYDHDGSQRNIVMPAVKDIIAEICRVFGLSQVPPGIWNQTGELLYVKGLEGSR